MHGKTAVSGFSGAEALLRADKVLLLICCVCAVGTTSCLRTWGEGAARALQSPCISHWSPFLEKCGCRARSGISTAVCHLLPLKMGPKE